MSAWQQSVMVSEGQEPSPWGCNNQSSPHRPCSASLPMLHLSPLCSALIPLAPLEGLQWVTQFAGLESTVLLGAPLCLPHSHSGCPSLPWEGAQPMAPEAQQCVCLGG